ncbi:MerR family transcriptional regulator [Paenibacillus baekrokdamisoli]|uniref:MerR family transcriptional regulator n=1 Tax=Paenibacillus baekrokdamisoli TaxID=1712516 RepID=A0A3G9J4K1_9BACL|nr:MerR family transcriptional regulator [Paenibacillus baekrokdamisoli]MBB3073295.1 DNA-binding transcriptional MerR regulator [Paenibacillus baekrokdamisoli]BBH23275.1 MerR family transcriptional regulator [Paenibacillus baekrokdamisoli]
MEWYTIGEVSKLCNIPIRTLRYYDDIALLVPDRISPETNYRYYSKEGMRKIPLIKYYKQLGFKLEDISRMLERPNFDVLEDYMAKELLIVEKQMAELQKKHFAIQEWKRLLKQGETLLAESQEDRKIEVASFPLYRTMKFRYEIQNHQAADIEVLYSNIFVALCHRHNVFAYGPFMLFFDDFSQRVDHTFTGVDCYTAVIEDESNAALTTEVGGFQAISVVHRGDYRTIGETYSEVQEWAERKEIRLQGASYERYIIDPWSTTVSDNYITELILPIGGNDNV